jgi:LmbE family N-acetylglucosaminyl deacetylase
MIDFAQIERVMVFGAHPDDEIIGPGGLIHRLHREGKEVHVVTFTCGETAAHDEGEMEAMAARRKAEMREADDLLGVSCRHILAIASQHVYQAVFHDNTLHHDLIRLLRQVRPQMLLTHAADNHRDHCAIATISPQAAFQAAEGILEGLGDPWRSELVLYYGVEGEPEGPNVVADIWPEDLEAKLAALRAQLSQVRAGYLERLEWMVRSRAELWGARCGGAGSYAEAFHLDSSHPLRIGA